MQIDPDSRRRVFRRIALGGALLTLPMIGYGLGYMQGSSAPEPAPREIVLNEAPAQDKAPAQAAPTVELAEAGAAQQQPATPEPEVLPEEPLAADSAPQPESLELAADLTAPTAEAEAVFSNPADEAAPAEKLGMEEAALLQPAVTRKAAEEAGDLDGGVVALTTEELPEDPLRTETLTVESGDTLMGLLTEAGIARGEAYEAITALEEVFSPRRLRAGQEITVALSDEAEAASLMSLVLQPDPETDVSVDRGDSGSFVALAKPRELTRGAEYGRGTIESSLYEASLSAGMPHGTLMELIRVFSFDVDFQRDIPSWHVRYHIKPMAIPENVSCGKCGMFPAKYPRWQSQIIFKDGTMIPFDGCKCMFNFIVAMGEFDKTHSRHNISAIWVKDFNSSN
ncbi:MAG: nitrous oxide reductase accessory protein NosL, partial [Limibacillus sp.]